MCCRKTSGASFQATGEGVFELRAFGIAILGIYFIVVGQFGSFKLPLVILRPVPLTLIGIMLGHWAFGTPFTATSLAGIIVRNSILLVDFIQGKRRTMPLRQVLLEAGAIRFKPAFFHPARSPRVRT